MKVEIAEQGHVLGTIESAPSAENGAPMIHLTPASPADYGRLQRVFDGLLVGLPRDFPVDEQFLADIPRSLDGYYTSARIVE